MSDETKIDCLPTIEQIIKMQEMHQRSGFKMSNDWNKDQKPEFYMGMFCMMRVVLSATKSIQNNEADLNRLESECILRLGELSTIIMDKYDLSFLKQ
jgi:hypothetical protein